MRETKELKRETEGRLSINLLYTWWGSFRWPHDDPLPPEYITGFSGHINNGNKREHNPVNQKKELSYNKDLHTFTFQWCPQ